MELRNKLEEYIAAYDDQSIEFLLDNHNLTAGLRNLRNVMDRYCIQCLEPLTRLLESVTRYHENYEIPLDHDLIQEITGVWKRNCEHSIRGFQNQSRIDPRYRSVNEQEITKLVRWLNASIRLVRTDALPTEERQKIDHLLTLLAEEVEKYLSHLGVNPDTIKPDSIESLSTSTSRPRPTSTVDMTVAVLKLIRMLLKKRLLPARIPIFLQQIIIALASPGIEEISDRRLQTWGLARIKQLEFDPYYGNNETLLEYASHVPTSWEAFNRVFRRTNEAKTDSKEVRWLKANISRMRLLPRDTESSPVTLEVIRDLTKDKTTKELGYQALCRLLSQDKKTAPSLIKPENVQLTPEEIDLLARDYWQRISNLPTDHWSRPTSISLFQEIWKAHKGDEHVYQLLINFVNGLYPFDWKVWNFCLGGKEEDKEDTEPIQWLKVNIERVKTLPQNDENLSTSLELIRRRIKDSASRDQGYRALCHLFSQRYIKNLKLTKEEIETIARDYWTSITNWPVDSISLSHTALPLLFEMWKIHNGNEQMYHIFMNFFHDYVALRSENPVQFPEEMIRWFISHPSTSSSNFLPTEEGLQYNLICAFFRQIIALNPALGYEFLFNSMQKQVLILNQLNREEILVLISKAHQLTSLPDHFHFAYLALSKLKITHPALASHLIEKHINNGGSVYDNIYLGKSEGYRSLLRENPWIDVSKQKTRGVTLLDLLTDENKKRITRLTLDRLSGLPSAIENEVVHDLIKSFPNIQYLRIEIRDMKSSDLIVLPENCKNLHGLEIYWMRVRFLSHMDHLTNLKIHEINGPVGEIVTLPESMMALKELTCYSEINIRFPPRSRMPKLETLHFDDRYYLSPSRIPEVPSDFDIQLKTFIPLYSHFPSSSSSSSSSSSDFFL